MTTRFIRIYLDAASAVRASARVDPSRRWAKKTRNSGERGGVVDWDADGAEAGKKTSGMKARRALALRASSRRRAPSRRGSSLVTSTPRRRLGTEEVRADAGDVLGDRSADRRRVVFVGGLECVREVSPADARWTISSARKTVSTPRTTGSTARSRSIASSVQANVSPRHESKIAERHACATALSDSLAGSEEISRGNGGVAAVEIDHLDRELGMPELVDADAMTDGDEIDRRARRR